MAPKILYTSRIVITPLIGLMKKNSTPTHRECFPLVHQRPEQDDRPRTTTRDSGEHFPAFNVAIRHDGVKKSGKADFLDADYASQVGSRALAACGGGLWNQSWGFATRRVNWPSYNVAVFPKGAHHEFPHCSSFDFSDVIDTF